MATLQTMYPGKSNSPITELAAAITDTDTSITVLDGTALPDGPNVAVIGQGETSETVQYAAKTGNTLTGVVRGFNGTTAAGWTAGTKVARNFTAYDYDTLRGNIDAVNTEVESATNEATPETIVKRDAGGRFKAAVPVAGDDVARLDSVTKAQVGLGSVDNFPTASQTEAEMGTSSNRFMTPLRTKQAIDKRLQNDLTLRYNEGNVEAWNGEEWVSVGGDPTLSNYFGQYGTFPFAGTEDVVISSNTTWDDPSGMRRVKKLTIEAGVTLRIMQTPFIIFADEVEFGDTNSTIDISGPSGSESADFTNLSFARGGTTVSGTAKAQGGCGGGAILVVSKRMSGAAGKIKANGGDAYSNTVSFSGTGSVHGESAFMSTSVNNTGEPPSVLPSAFFSGSSSHVMGRTRTLQRILGRGGSGGGYHGGSGIGGGGSIASSAGNGSQGQQPETIPRAGELVQLILAGLLGGGGGNAYRSGATGSGGGGGGGCILILVRDLSTNPVMELNGGKGSFNGNEDLSASGAAGQGIITVV